MPIFGWLGLRRESKLHGRGFWIRPMLVELFSGVGLAVLYWWEVGQAGLLAAVPNPIPADWAGNLNAQFFCHAVLILLMLVASLIDADEKTIPDAIAVPGTLLGLAAAALYPWSLLPANVAGPPGDFLWLTSPQALARLAQRRAPLRLARAGRWAAFGSGASPCCHGPGTPATAGSGLWV